MYDFLRGQVVNIDARGHLSFAVQGVGYLLRISEQTRQAIPLDASQTTIHTRLIVREDDLQLFGFADVAERAAFDLLTTVQGIGPSIAMEILSRFGIDDLRQALIRSDSTAFQEVKGIGRKSAERIVLELADKVERIPGSTATISVEKQAADEEPSSDDRAYRGLIALGFSRKEAADALRRIDDSIEEPGERVRAALALLR